MHHRQKIKRHKIERKYCTVYNNSTQYTEYSSLQNNTVLYITVLHKRNSIGVVLRNILASYKIFMFFDFTISSRETQKGEQLIDKVLLFFTCCQDSHWYLDIRQYLDICWYPPVPARLPPDINGIGISWYPYPSPSKYPSTLVW